jgi:alpha-D-xyloside xylohydrolase
MGYQQITTNNGYKKGLAMKFTDGYWQIQPGCTPHYAVQVHDVETTPDSLTIYATTHRIEHRGDTLNSAILTVRYCSPFDNIIKVEIWHHQGGLPTKPEFQLESHPDTQVDVLDRPDAASLTTGDLSLQVHKSPDWRVEFRDSERLLTHSGWRSVGFVDTPGGRYIHEQLGLGVGECVYGLGERFTPFVKNGQVVDMWNADGGTSSEQAYKNIPFYLTNRGYGVLVAHPEKVSFEIASEKVTRVQFSVPGERLTYYLIYGPSPKEVLSRYTKLTGRPALPPAWSFGLWLSTSFTTDYSEATVSSLIEGMAEREIPLSVFHFDCFWMKEFHWSNFEWDERLFPDPEGMLKRLKESGLKICVWINPYIAQRSALFAEGMKHGYLLRRPDGSVWQWDKWQAGMAIVDFTNPAACRWYADKLRALVKMGVDCFKTDFGERIPTEVVFFDGSDPVRMHNYYPYLYNKTVFAMLEEELGPGAAIVFARSATVGGQQFPVHWGGDNTATFESMAESLRGGLSLALSGFSFWSHDIGGFELTAPAEIYKRWCAFGLLSSHSRLHGSSSYRVPWHFDEEAVVVLRFFTRLKCSLMPYLFGAAVEAHQRGIPMMRAMLLEFPGDPACEYLDRQYMLGDSLLVAPVFSFDGDVRYYVPAGRWTSFISGEVIEGPGWVQETHGYLSLPLLARPNSVIPVGNIDHRPDYDYGNAVTLRLYQFAEGSYKSITVPTQTGGVDAVFETKRRNGQIAVRCEGNTKPWRVLLVGVEAVAAVEGGSVEKTIQGVLITAIDKVLTIKLERSDG